MATHAWDGDVVRTDDPAGLYIPSPQIVELEPEVILRFYQVLARSHSLPNDELEDLRWSKLHGVDLSEIAR